MDPKTFRYMQRIERIIGTPQPINSPIRPSKSPLICKTNRLDRYLKFELAAKISASFILKNHKKLTALFFNAIRNCEPQQRERIYKFIPIEKKQDAIRMKVDVNIAVRLFKTVLSQLLQKRMQKCFEMLKQYQEQEEKESNKFQRIQLPAFKGMSRVTSRKDQQSTKRKVSQWNDAAPTSIINENLKIQKKNFKQFVLRNIANILRKGLLKRKAKGLQLIKLCAKQRKISKIRKDCQIYEKELSKRISEVEAQQEIKMDKQQRYAKQIKTLEQKLLKFSEHLKSTKYDSKIIQIPEESQQYKTNDQDIVRLLLSYHHKYKTNFIKFVKNGLKSTYFLNKKGKQVQCYGFLHKMTAYIDRRRITALRIIKKWGIHQQLNKSRALKMTNILIKITNMKINTYNHCFFLQISKKSSLTKQKSNLLNLDKIRYDNIKAKSEVTKINTPRSIQTDLQSHTPISKVNFYIFIEKMAKFILIMSKLLVPLKQSFVAIDLYASNVYKLEQAFLKLNYRYKQLCFKKIKSHNPLKKSRGKEQRKAINEMCNTLSLNVKDRYIEAFSRIKIMTTFEHFKIQIMPIKCNFEVQTRRFLAERQEANKKNEQTWNRLLQEINSSK